MSRDSSKLEVQNLVECPRGEDGGHKWSVKQWSGIRAKCLHLENWQLVWWVADKSISDMTPFLLCCSVAGDKKLVSLLEVVVPTDHVSHSFKENIIEIIVVIVTKICTNVYIKLIVINRWH